MKSGPFEIAMIFLSHVQENLFLQMPYVEQIRNFTVIGHPGAKRSQKCHLNNARGITWVILLLKVGPLSKVVKRKS